MNECEQKSSGDGRREYCSMHAGSDRVRCGQEGCVRAEERSASGRNQVWAEKLNVRRRAGYERKKLGVAATEFRGAAECGGQREVPARGGMPQRERALDDRHKCRASTL
jgi:hypothetical protein